MQLLNVFESIRIRLAYWESKPDRGIYHARTKVQLKATGAWICFLNAGDVFDNKFVVEKMVAVIPTDKSAKILYGDVITLGKDGERNEKLHQHFATSIVCIFVIKVLLCQPTC